MIDFFTEAYKDVPLWHIIIEFVVFVFGILSVWYAKKENIWVYPTGLIATVITVYLLFIAGYLGDMLVNAYFSIMSIYGWYNWSKGTGTDDQNLAVSRTTFTEKWIGVAFFFLTIIVVFGIYKLYDYEIKPDNYIDILSSGIFFTAMWYMAKKKIENWTLWIIGDIIAVPLYAYRGLGMLSLQYLIFTILAIAAYLQWKKALDNSQPKY